MSKPTYHYPYFVEVVTLQNTDSKRYWLKLKFDNHKKEGIIVILKNPSRANKTVSDKTVYNVSNYIYRNQDNYVELKNIGTVIFLNLIPHYLTYSSKLKEFQNTLIDQKNLKVLNEVCRNHKKVIIAWGNHPQGLYNEYEQLKNSVMQILANNTNEIFFVDRMTKGGNPKHGQVWGYSNKLQKLI